VRIAGVVALALAVAASAFSSSTRPRVWLADEAPLTVAGTAFRPREHVRVRFGTSGRLWSKTLVAGQTGRFSVQFPLVQLEDCAMWYVRAEGDGGSRVTLRHIAECASQ
jgi:hypothetical protein